ncbi:hypothetical protein PIB30_112801, partial [Stylosanthes scabra]|nr:hypothetical protein [Stylosanthes scabra]
SPSGNVLPRLTACRVLLPRGGPIIARSAGIAPSNPSARSSLSNWRRLRIIGCRAVTEVKPVEVGFAVRGSVCVLRPILPPGAGGAARPKEERQNSRANGDMWKFGSSVAIAVADRPE